MRQNRSKFNLKVRQRPLQLTQRPPYYTGSLAGLSLDASRPTCQNSAHDAYPSHDSAFSHCAPVRGGRIRRAAADRKPAASRWTLVGGTVVYNDRVGNVATGDWLRAIRADLSTGGLTTRRDIAQLS